MKNDAGQIIYVGKAKNLKNRVRQYFFNGVKTNKVMAMVSCIADFEYVITKTETDALSLENNLIKKHKPKYNILLKDDKSYPYLKINLKEKYPTFYVVRKIRKDGYKYFGPFMNGVSVKSLTEILQTAFSLRPCNIKLKEKPMKPCLNYHIKRCPAPCAFLISEEDYKKNVSLAIDFLNGNDKTCENLLKEKMELCAKNEEFELALSYRDKLFSLGKIWQKKITANSKIIDADIFSYATDKINSVINVEILRGGRILGSKNYVVNDISFDGGETLTEFILRFYTSPIALPPEIIVSENVNAEVLENYLKKEYGKEVSVNFAKQGVRRQYAEMSLLNANDYLERNVEKISHKEDMTTRALSRLQEVLHLKNYPQRMECYDISHISGVDKVGSMVVFTGGEKDKKEYRRFKIKTVAGNDDFACLQEVLKRRLSKLNSEEKDRFFKPELIIIDGGKGQLSSVKEIFDEFGVFDIDLISLAKREEEIFIPDINESVLLDKSDYALRLLQAIRDEAHRFAITYNRTLRGKHALESVLSEIDGVGKEKRKALIEKFKDIEGIIAAKKEDLTAAEGIGDKLAQKIYEFFHDRKISD